MALFKVASMEMDYQQVVIIWLEEKYLGKDDEIKKHLEFFKDIIDCPNILVMILDKDEKPTYYGNKNVANLLKFQDWKRFPWQQFELNKD
jgi:hypothetical protein